MLRIGQIQYANCTPIFHALKELYPRSGYDYLSGVPSRLNALLANGEIDVCPSSSIVYALHPEKFLIVPDISISSCGPVASVLLFSRLPIEELDGKLVLLTSESATSVNLLKILLAKRFNCSCSFRTTKSVIREALQEAPAVLLIGDSALVASTAASGVRVYDLGELWYSWTGTPFVFALWLAGRTVSEKHGQELRQLAEHLQNCKEFAAANLEKIADGSEDVIWMGRERLLAYWRTNIMYDLSENYRRGVSLFFKMAAEIGLIPQDPSLIFLD